MTNATQTNETIPANGTLLQFEGALYVSHGVRYDGRVPCVLAHLEDSPAFGGGEIALPLDQIKEIK